MINIDEKFDEYITKVHKANPVAKDSVQYKETKQAFYAGIAMLMDEFIEISNNDAISELQSEAILDNVVHQLKMYSIARALELGIIKKKD